MVRCCLPARAVRLAVAGILAAPAVALAQPVPPARLSVATDGTEANGHSFVVDRSRDGRHVLFTSQASNLVAGDSNGAVDLFVRDRDTDGDGVLDEPGAVRTLRVNEGLGGEQTTTAASTFTRLSPDARFVLFATDAALVTTDTNGLADVYLRDRDADANGVFDESGAVALHQVSTGTGGAQADQPSTSIGMTDSGRFVLFATAATTLQGRLVNGVSQIYRKDRQTGVTVLVSSTVDGAPADLAVGGAALSPDGRFAVIVGGFAALVPGGTGTARYPWVLRDLDTNAFTPIAVAAAPQVSEPVGTGAIAPGGFRQQGVRAFSPDGRFVYLTDVGGVVSLGISFVSGRTYEYDVSAAAFTRLIPGMTTPSDGVPVAAFVDGRSFVVTGSSSRSVGAAAIDGLYSYDAATGRTTALVGGDLCPGFARGGTRLLYRDSCTSGSLMLLDTAYGTPLPVPPPVHLGQMGAAGTMTIFSTQESTILPGGADTNGAYDVFAVDLLSRLDRDADTLDDRWEAAMSLDYASSAGVDGAAGDPDGDGQTNAQEEDAASHPRGASRQFLAEGADNAFFRTRLALANPGTTAGTAVVRLDGDDGTSQTVNVFVPAGAKRTVFVDDVGRPSSSFATSVESPVPLVAERTMSWGATEYGAHAERASAAPSTTWFLAEGATGGFSLFYLLQNPGDTAATATVRYLRPVPLPPIERSYLLAARSRVTLPVNLQAPELASTDVSAAITATAPILVERAMYRSVDGQPFAAGHASAGVTAAATSWFLAEGATGDFFDLFILLANPNPTTAQVEIRYSILGQVITMFYVVAPESRRTIYVDAENVGEIGPALAHGPVASAITVTNGVPIVVERSMWFPGPAISPQFWTEAHNSPGATGAATRWVLADGESGGSRETQTFVLIANTSSTAGRARVTVLPDQPTVEGSVPPPPPIETVVDLPPNSRTTIPMGLPPFGTAGRRYGVVVESIETTPLAQLVVERAMYWNAGGVVWAAGTNLLATPVP